MTLFVTKPYLRSSGLRLYDQFVIHSLVVILMITHKTSLTHENLAMGTLLEGLRHDLVDNVLASTITARRCYMPRASASGGRS